MQKQSELGKPTSYRWFMLFIICLMYLITYMDRVNISTTAPMIRKEFGFDKITMGFIFSAFTFAYSLGQVPGGWIGDRFGPRKVLPALVTFWSVMTLATAQAGSLVQWILIRALFGAGEAGAFPTATRAMQLWYSPSERGFIQGITHSATRIGAAIVPPISVLIMAKLGWRWVFYIFGLTGVIWSAIFYLIYRNLPEEHRSVNQAEVAKIRGFDENGNIKEPINIKKRPTVPWGVLLKSSNMWYLMIIYAIYIYTSWIFLTWLPIYMMEYRKFSLMQMGIFASLPLWAGVIGDTFGGVVSDYILKKTNNIRLARRSVAVGGTIGAVALLLPGAMTKEPYTAVACLTGAMFFLECILGPAWAVAMDVGGEYSGTVSGLMNMAGTLAGAFSQILFGVITQYGSWVAPFVVSSVLLTIGGFMWAFLLDPARSVVEKRRPEVLTASNA
jgi:sugar phosphate permease